MKKNLRRNSIAFGLTVAASLAMAAVSFADDKSSSNNQQPGQSQSQTKIKADSPKNACNSIIDAAKKDDFQSVQQLTIHWGHGRGEHGRDQAGTAGDQQGHMRKEFENMRQDHMNELKQLSCGSEHIAGDHAVVESSGKDQKRLIPFVMENGQWKFDARTYMSFYRSESMSDMKSKPSSGSTSQSDQNKSS